ncbi:hypothetical protein PR002_g25015 [Phytophthora rubi]|uniref:Uncharacterized protein n=1 Tax=Phytophthora rubi TaxID=129364 RepID=A0A6A3I5M2_9STRA|nr:hypothetical protein PR002_g25015 [Phytophthora rubi]
MRHITASGSGNASVAAFCSLVLSSSNALRPLLPNSSPMPDATRFVRRVAVASDSSNFS